MALPVILNRMELLLSRDGIFPITRNAQGQPLCDLPASGLPFPGTIQGEGKLAGVPSLFVRTAGCNLRCVWRTSDGSLSPCDTAYASYHPEGTYRLPVEEVAALVLANTDAIRHLVITGGEPLLQAPQVEALIEQLRRHHPYHITIESNGTLFHPGLARAADLMSLSPKLSSSTAATPGAVRPETTRINPEVLQQYIDTARQQGTDFQLKFVCTGEEDIREIRALLARLQGWKNTDILLMPVGRTAAELRQSGAATLIHAIRQGWRYCDRLHIALFGDKAGV